MMSQTVEINENEVNLRLDVFLTERLHDLSRSHVQKLIGAHAVSINGIPAKANYKTRLGDVVEVEIPGAKALTKALPEDLPIDVVYEDSDLIVVNKAKGMVAHPAPGAESGTLVNALLYHCNDLSGIGGILRPGIVHRLDKDTSGLLVVAKNDLAHLSLAKQIKERSATRKYQSLLWGRVPFKHAVIDAPIARHPTDRKRMTVYDDLETTIRNPRRENDIRLPRTKAQLDQLEMDDSHDSDDITTDMWKAHTARGGRMAVTEVRLLEHLGVFSWIEAILQTGRTHQIRVHMAFAGYPVVGDKVYGGNRRVSAEEIRGPSLAILNDKLNALHGQVLHAYSLAFNHPKTNKRLQFHVEPPAEIGDLVDYLRRLDES
jgi:23S rRNA pseudouridine1911/1915/1917 synthase